MELTLYQIDAFTSDVFRGNPAAVVPLESWLDDNTLQAIANENNLSETSYIVPRKTGYEIRWFTPLSEIELCGHATLASAYVVLSYLKTNKESVMFESRFSGSINVTKIGELYSMNFPRLSFEQCSPSKNLEAGLQTAPNKIYKGVDYLAIFEKYEQVVAIKPNYAALELLDGRGIIVSSPGPDGSSIDFVSRYFCPKYGVPEDPVCGSAHCMLTPYWANRLSKLQLTAHQVSPRGGKLQCTLIGDRVELKGEAVEYLKGRIKF